MKKFLTAVFVSLALVFTGVVSAPIASAAPSIETSVSAKGSFGTIHTPGVAIAAPKAIGNGGIKPTWYTLAGYCYWGMDGGYYCYRYGCTNWEYWFYGCRDGWYRVNNYWYV